jgi:streptogramin lyase
MTAHGSARAASQRGGTRDLRIPRPGCGEPGFQGRPGPGGGRSAGRTRSVRLLGLACLTLLGIALSGCTRLPPAAGPRTYSFWPPAPNAPRVQFLASFDSSVGIEPPKSTVQQLAFGREKRPGLVISKPYGVAMWKGSIYACDTRGSAVVVIDLQEHQIRVMGTSGANRLLKPTAITVAPDGTKYVAETSRGSIAVYGTDDRQISLLGHAGLKPANLAVRGDELFVADLATHAIVVMDRKTGKILRTIGAVGHDPGQLFGPLGLGLDAQGCVYVTDMDCRLQKFDPSGKLLWGIGTVGRTPGSFTRPKQLAIDSKGYIYVVDAAFQNVQMFDAEGRLLMDFGGSGDFPGSMELPVGICVYEGDLGPFAPYVHPAFAAERLIVVTSQLGPNKVAVYALGQQREGMSVGLYTTPPTTAPAPPATPGTAVPALPTTAPAADAPASTAPPR